MLCRRRPEVSGNCVNQNCDKRRPSLRVLSTNLEKRALETPLESIYIESPDSVVTAYISKFLELQVVKLGIFYALSLKPLALSGKCYAELQFKIRYALSSNELPVYGNIYYLFPYISKLYGICILSQFRRFFQFQLNFGKYFTFKRNSKNTSQHNYKINTAIHKERQAVPY